MAKLTYKMITDAVREAAEFVPSDREIEEEW
jgi:hypothetical protein